MGLIMSTLRWAADLFTLNLLFSNPFCTIVAKDCGKHFLAHLVELLELMNVFTTQ